MFVSVLLPAYNDERWLPYAVESALAQTHRDFELLLVNDGSTDGTLAVMQCYAKQDARVRIISHANMGLARSLNAGIEAAQAAWIARMDSDDIMLPTRLEQQVAFVQRHPEVAATAGLGVYINEAGHQIGRKARARFTKPGAARQALARGQVVQLLHSAVLMRKDAVLAVGGYRPQFTVTEDADLWSRLLEAGYELLEQPEYLQQIRFRRVSASGGGYVLQQRQLRWIIACSTARQAGLLEPTFEQFLAAEHSGSQLHRMNVRRKDAANNRFHRALWAYANGRRLSAARDVLISSALDPARAARRVVPRVVHAVRP